MQVSRIIAEIDAEISKLQRARELLAGTASLETGKGPGRPKGSKNARVAVATSATRKPKLSAAGRKSISDAMKRRWAERRKQASKAAATSK